MNASYEFLKAIQAAGLTPPEHVVPDGKLHRFASNGKRGDDSGWYVLHGDGIPAGAFGCWRGSVKLRWRADIGRALTPAEEAAYQAKVDAACRAREVEEAREHAQAAQNAAWILKCGHSAPAGNPYLLRKGVTPVPSLLEIDATRAFEILGYAPKSRGEPLVGRLLVVPVKVGEELSTVEFIDEGGRKSALSGGAKAGGHWAAQPFPEGDGAGLTLLIGEGVATVLSAREATGHLVIAALTSSNLKAVAREMRERYPSADLVILADLVKDTGLTDPHAIEAAHAVGGLLAVPDFGPDRPPRSSDFNDLHRLQGLEAVAECIAAQVAAHAAQEPENAGSDSQNKDDSESSENSRLDAVAIHVLSGDPPTQRARSQADILIDIGQQVAQALFLGDDDRAYAVVRDRSEVWPIASKRFREWLRSCYFKRVGKGANANSVRDAVETIAARAQFGGDTRKVFLRTAEADGKLYVDLTDHDWRVVEIDQDDWRVLDHSPVMFTRRGSPAPLPVPTPGGSLAPLWPLLNVPEASRSLVAGWLLAALYPSGPYPILVLQGEEGTAKSTAARMLRSLCDPSLVPLRAPTRDEKDFLVGAIGSWCVCIDNVSDMAVRRPLPAIHRRRVRCPHSLHRHR